MLTEHRHGSRDMILSLAPRSLYHQQKCRKDHVQIHGNAVVGNVITGSYLQYRIFTIYRKHGKLTSVCNILFYQYLFSQGQ